MPRGKRLLRAEQAAQKTRSRFCFRRVLSILPALPIVILAPALMQAIRTLSPRHRSVGPLDGWRLRPHRETLVGSKTAI
jgi:hypothetical protein